MDIQQVCPDRSQEKDVAESIISPQQGPTPTAHRATVRQSRSRESAPVVTGASSHGGRSRLYDVNVGVVAMRKGALFQFL